MHIMRTLLFAEVLALQEVLFVKTVGRDKYLTIAFLTMATASTPLGTYSHG